MVVVVALCLAGEGPESQTPSGGESGRGIILYMGMVTPPGLPIRVPGTFRVCEREGVPDT